MAPHLASKRAVDFLEAKVRCPREPLELSAKSFQSTTRLNCGRVPRPATNGSRPCERKQALPRERPPI